MQLEKEFPHSKQVKKAEYIPERQKLILTFIKGDRYEYSLFPSYVWEELLEAESIGEFLNEKIKNKYEYVKIVL